MHSLMLLSNAYRPDPRVEREMTSLVKRSHRVTLVCWDRKAELPARESRFGVEVVRVHHVKSGYGAGIKQLIHIPRFWKAAFSLAIRLKPDVVHCHDLDTLYAGVQIKKRLGCPLIFDAHEDYPALMSLYLPKWAVSLLAILEKRYLSQVDETITASQVYAEKLVRQGLDRVTPIGNYPSLHPFESIGEEQVQEARARLDLSPAELAIVYIGGFTRNRQLLPVIQAVEGLERVQLHLWGDGHQRRAVEQAASQLDNVHYHGWLAAEQVPLHFLLADVIYYCLLPDYPGAVYNAPNTLSNAMAAGRPIIANDVGDLGRIVRETGCGILVPEVTPQAIRQAIVSLLDQSRRVRMGAAGNSAARGQFHLGIVEKLLDEIYTRIQEAL